MATYPHTVHYTEPHKFPRWSRFVCSKCQRRFEVHDSEWDATANWIPPKADCPLLNPPRKEKV